MLCAELIYLLSVPQRNNSSTFTPFCLTTAKTVRFAEKEARINNVPFFCMNFVGHSLSSDMRVYLASYGQDGRRHKCRLQVKLLLSDFSENKNILTKFSYKI